MANTIDVKGAIVNITPTKAVKFDKMMGSTGGASGQGKSAKFSDKGEFKNLGKFVVLVGQSLKKMNVNLLQTKKEITGLRKENGEKLTAIANAIGAQRTELKSFAKSQKKANKTLKDLAGKVGTSLELDKIRNKGALEDRKERRRDRAERRRSERESALEKGRKAVGAVGSGLGKLAKGGKNFLETIMDFLGIGGFIASVVTAFAGYQILKKALNSNFVKNTVKGFMEGMQSLIAGIQAIPEGAFDKIGNALGGIAKFLGGAFGKTIESIGKFIDGVPQETLNKFGKFFGNVFKFVSAFVGDRFKEVFQGLDKIIDKDGNLKFDLGGIVNLITGIGGLALAYRYIKNPTKIIDDVGSVLGFFGSIAGKAGAMPGPIGKVFSIFAERGSSPLKPMYVEVVGGGLGGGLGGGIPKGPGLKIAKGMSAARGSGLNTGGSKISRLMQAGKNAGALARPGSIINATTGRATRMLGGNKAIDVAKNLKGADATKYLRKAVLSGTLTERQALNIAKSKGPNFLKNFRGVLAQGGNLGRGLATRGGNALAGARQGFGNFMSGLGQKGMGLLRGAKGVGQNLLAGALALPGNAMNLAKGIGQKAMTFGGSAVGGIKGSLRSLGEGLSNLNPAKALEKIKGGVGSKIDEIMKAEPLIAAIKNLKDPKKMKEILKSTLSRAKPALKGIKDARKAMGPFKIPGLDAAIGALTAAIEIFAFKQPAGNAALGAIGGILGSAAGTAVGTPGGPPGMFIGAMSGAVLGELAGRAIARGLGNVLPPEIGGFTGINGAPLFSTAGLSENPEPADGEAPLKKARGGKIFGGRPTGDSVPAYLERGEYVLNRKAVSAIGPSNLDAMNFGAFPRFQSGGQVSRQEGWDKFTEWGKEKGAKYPQLVSAQWALESGWGSALSAKNNFFGIKATSSESSANHRTREVVNGKDVYINANFKNFETPQDAVDHLVSQWYKNYKSYKGVNNAGSPNEAAAMLKQQGYATDPSYPQKLIELMQSKGVSSGPAYISGDANSKSDSSSKPNRGGGFLSNLVGFMQEGGSVDKKHPLLKKLSDGKIRKVGAPMGMCVTGSLDTMKASGVPEPAATGSDVGNNPRGAISQLMQSPFNWKSMGGSKIKLDSPYGKVNAGTYTKDQYKSLVESGKVPSGALVFQSRHSNWNGTSPGSRGYDMAIAQQGGKKHWNGQPMPMFVYGNNTKKVIVLTPDGKQGDGSDVQITGEDNSYTGIDSSSNPQPSTAENNYGFLGTQDVLASGGITSQKNIAAMTKGIMALAGDVGKAGGGGMFGGPMGGAIQPAAPAGFNPAPNPVSTAQGATNPTSGSGLSLISNSTTNRVTEAKGDMR
ncbi:hypothetical protein SBM3_00043 [Synechococcus phage S-BM3]|nr:hypothetical protein SBM3_00043 [Synechococcus phage S-BM3]